MKTILISLLAFGITAGLRAGDLSVADGTTYHHITKQRVDPDGLYIEYTPAGGGLAMEKIKFSRLTADQQKEFGYDPARSAEFEAQCGKAMAMCEAQAVLWDEAAKAARGQRQASDSAEEKEERQFALALAQIQANASASSNPGYYPYYSPWSLGGGYTLTAVPRLNGVLRTVNGGLRVAPSNCNRPILRNNLRNNLR